MTPSGHYFKFICRDCGDTWENPPSLPSECKECGSENLALEETTAPLGDEE